MVNRISQLDWLGEKTTPHYGQATLWVVLVCGTCLVSHSILTRPAEVPIGARAGPATVLSWLPDQVLLDERVRVASAVVFVVAAVLWSCCFLIPWSSWTAALAFTSTMALHHENSEQATHGYNLVNMMLIIYAMWYHFYCLEIRAARAQRAFWRTLLYPRWVYALSVFYVALYYGLSGISKLTTSGLDWPNGTSLQLWVTLWGDRDSFWTQQILQERSFASLLQWLTLFIETGALSALYFSRLRPVIGMGLIAFHYASISVFGWGFHANVAIVAVVLLPVDSWIGRIVGRAKTGNVRQP